MTGRIVLALLTTVVGLTAVAECGHRKQYNHEYRNEHKQNWKRQYSGGYNKYAKKHTKYDDDKDSYIYKYNYKYKYNKYDPKPAPKKPTPVPVPPNLKKPSNPVNKKIPKQAIPKKTEKPINKKQQVFSDAQKTVKQQVKADMKAEPTPVLIETIEIQQIQQIKRKDIQEIVEETPKPVKQQEQPGIDCQEKPVYDYNLLVLTWVPAECYADKQCQKDWQTYDDLRSPTIHGYRPFSSSSYYENCFGHSGDHNCRTNAYMMDFQIDEALWNVTGLLYDVSQYWPAHKFTHDDENFYTQQWLVHGTCYLMNMIEDNQNAFKTDKAGFNRTIMVEYFKTAINKFRKLEIDLEPGKQYNSKQQFAEDIGFKNKETHFVLTCDKDNEIMEIIFCFNRSKLPGKEVTIPCTLGQSCDQDKPFRLKKPL